MSYKAFDVVVVPFPFTDRETVKRRPALVLSGARFNDEIEHSVLAMITSASRSRWPLDTSIGDPGAAGLPAASLVRMKLFTLDHRLILRRVGSLARRDRDAVARALRSLLKDCT